MSRSLETRAILDGFSQMIDANRFGASQISNGARQFQNAEKRARRKLQLLHGRFQQALPGSFYGAESAHLGWPHLGVAGQLGPVKAPGLQFARRLDTRANGD